MKVLRTLGLVLGMACWGQAAPAWAQPFEFRAYARAHVNDVMSNTGRTDNQQVLASTLPDVGKTYQFDSVAQLPDGGATAHFLGGMGWLKAEATASYAWCCSLTGHTVAHGISDGTVGASFFDTVAVAGAGLALGTPVSYRLDFSISGHLSSPAFEMGGSLTADGVADARLTDRTTQETVSLRWDAKQQVPGTYSLVLNTVVGHELVIGGSLFVQAVIESSASTARSVSADFYHSAYYTLAPSVQGLNALGASGHDFAISAVPEPGTAALWLLGLAGWGGWSLRLAAGRRGVRPALP